MTEPIITYRNMDATPSITREIHDRYAKLARLNDKISHCEVVVEAPQRQHKGGHFHVSIRMGLPGAELVADRDPDMHAAHADIHVALRDAFDSMRRRMLTHLERIRA